MIIHIEVVTTESASTVCNNLASKIHSQCIANPVETCEKCVNSANI
jgi:hypothetical protein